MKGATQALALWMTVVPIGMTAAGPITFDALGNGRHDRAVNELEIKAFDWELGERHSIGWCLNDENAMPPVGVSLLDSPRQSLTVDWTSIEPAVLAIAPTIQLPDLGPNREDLLVASSTATSSAPYYPTFPEIAKHKEQIEELERQYAIANDDDDDAPPQSNSRAAILTFLTIAGVGLVTFSWRRRKTRKRGAPDLKVAALLQSGLKPRKKRPQLDPALWLDTITDTPK